ncbi:MAG: AMP-binding protein [Gammaproteobacteria bacterium]|nr:AMP-binding protein [Gammaproteobacteria bacterium]
MNMARWVQSQARFLPNKTAIVFERDPNGAHSHEKKGVSSSPQILTYAELENRVSGTVSLLRDHFLLTKGERIAWLGLNHPDMFVLLLAAARMGIIVVPMSWRLSENELTYIVDDCAPKVLFHDQHEAGKAHALSVLAKQPNTLTCVSLDDDSSGPTLSQLLDNAAFSREERKINLDAYTHITAEEACLIVYTSGTTGRPKGAVLSQGAMICNAQMSQHMYDLGSRDIVLNVLPLFHVGGINIQPLPALMFGATLILHQQFNPTSCVNAIQHHSVSLINTVPTILQAMQNTAEWQDASLQSLKSISIGSTDVPRTLIDTVHEKGLPLVQVYGATETGPIAIYQRPEKAVTTAGSIGQEGLLCEVKLCDAQGDAVEVNMPGEICIRGDNILTGYWNNKEATAQAIDNDWFHTGDVAHIDKDGNYWFDDRLKHVIISGGENIYPAEIERVIVAIADIDAVSVVGQRHAKWGEIPVAVVVKIADSSHSEESVRKMIESSCQAALAKFKQPKKVVFVDKLPRNAMGKVVANEVRGLVCRRDHRGD